MAATYKNSGLNPWTAEDEATLLALMQRKDAVQNKLRDELYVALGGLLNENKALVIDKTSQLVTYMIDNAKSIRDALALADDGVRPPMVAEKP